MKIKFSAIESYVLFRFVSGHKSVIYFKLSETQFVERSSGTIIDATKSTGNRLCILVKE